MRSPGFAKAGFDYCAGLEVEFHLFKIENPRLEPEDVAVWPAEPPEVTLTTQGFQYLTETRFDQVGPIMDVLRETMLGLGMPLRSQEVELGPSQYEFTFAPEVGIAAADTMVLFRSRNEAGGAAARPSGELHVPAEISQRVLQRLASAPVADRPQDEGQCVRLERQVEFFRRSAATISPG